ncbi:MAG: polyamine aminopropyltransferase [Spirochaetes bacterium]|jgi:spermidine synthase|nr:polyamine aminopropyltransferase [Spirochaetota bacterium]
MQNSEPARLGKDRMILLASVFVVASCGIVYQLVAGAVSSYIMGDAVTQFSLVIGVFMCSMGIGSYSAQFIKNSVLKKFIDIEIAIGLIGGLSGILMFSVSSFVPELFPLFFYVLCASLGIMIGVEVPLIIRILNKEDRFTHALSNVLALDYIGGLSGSILFPLIALPFLGLTKASIVFGIMNFAVAGGAIHLLRKKERRGITIRFSFATLVLILGFIFSTRLISFFEDQLYQDSIIFLKQTRYQKIVLTRWRDDIRLYLNGQLQFCSIDEARYHESLVIPAMESSVKPERMLILGGGDGMVIREILKYPSVTHIDLVDIDPEVTTIFSERPELVALNINALTDSRVAIHNRDAMSFLMESNDFYDIIISDLPDPNSSSLSKLYSTSFYSLLFRRLSHNGVFATQATSPYYAPRAFWCIKQTIEHTLNQEEGTTAFMYPYHVNVPSFGEWGFIMASRRQLPIDTIAPAHDTRFLTAESIKTLFAFGKDVAEPDDLKINNLENPTLYRYYEQGWRYFND